MYTMEHYLFIKNNGIRMNKEDVVYIHNGILLSHEKEWNEKECKLESIMLSKISQLEKDKYHMISLISGI